MIEADLGVQICMADSINLGHGKCWMEIQRNSFLAGKFDMVEC
jgi:hypothetical protein